MGASHGHQLVFVGGLHRSGTTALARTLALHPDVSGFSETEAVEDEGQHLQDVYPAAREYGGVGRFAFDEAAHLTEASSLASPASAERLLDQWRLYWDAAAPVWVEKSPPNLVMTRFLQALFPDARFIVIVRHPLVVALATRKWARFTSIDRLVQHWIHAHRVLFDDAPRISRLHVVHYEDLVADPHDSLGRIASFLSLPGTVPAGSLDGRRSQAYARRWDDLRGSVLPWRSRRARRLVARYADEVAEFGYVLDDLTRIPEGAVASRLPRAGDA